MKSTVNIQSWRKEFHTLVTSTFPRLVEMKEQNDRKGFNELMMKLLPGVKKYIARRLGTAVRNGQIPSMKYKVEDFVDELFIKAYDHIQEVKADKDFHAWLFKKADELLEDAIVEEEFDNTFFENIDNYGKLEWDEMEEKFSTDGNGHLLMEEELDDISYPKHDYTLADVFVEDKSDDLIEKLNRELNEAEIHRHIDVVLQRMPANLSTVFDLAVNQHFPLDEIATIKQLAIEEVERQLAEARRLIRLSFEKRFL